MKAHLHRLHHWHWRLEKLLICFGKTMIDSDFGHRVLRQVSRRGEFK